MNLTIDIGNTNVMICIFKNNQIIKCNKVNVINFSKNKQYNFFKKLFLKYKILNVLISSVVPGISEKFFEIFEIESFITIGNATNEFKSWTSENGFEIDYRESIGGYVRK